jgi:phage baseplate assembly protein V
MSTQHAPNVAVGIVSDNEDPEGMGRVKLTFPWRAAEDESNWARIAVPMAGGDRGTWFLPEVGDEVLVAFEGGELAHPYVIGALWNGEDSPPESNDGDNDVRAVTSREGHSLTFDDASDGGVEIETNAGHTITLTDESGGETVTIEDSSGSNVIEFDATAQELSIEAGAKLAIDAPQVELTADGNISIDASGMLTLNGAMIKLN